MLAKEESLIPRMFTNLRRGITPLLDDGIYTVIQVRVDGWAGGWAFGWWVLCLRTCGGG